MIFSVLKFTQHLTFEKLTKEVFTFKQNIGAKRRRVIFPPKFEKFEKVKREHLID
jgi:hypothetical protein